MVAFPIAGTAPVIDSCGSAGGRLPGQAPGGAGANYQNNSLAHLGMPGSALPAMAPQASWKAGSLVEAGWAIGERRPSVISVVSEALAHSIIVAVLLHIHRMPSPVCLTICLLGRRGPPRRRLLLPASTGQRASERGGFQQAPPARRRTVHSALGR